MRSMEGWTEKTAYEGAETVSGNSDTDSQQKDILGNPGEGAGDAGVSAGAVGGSSGGGAEISSKNDTKEAVKNTEVSSKESTDKNADESSEADTDKNADESSEADTDENADESSEADTDENAEENSEADTDKNAEENTAEDAEGKEGEDSEESSFVDVSELLELLKDCAESNAEAEADVGTDTFVPEAPFPVTDEAAAEALAQIRSTLDGMSVSMNSIHADTAAYQEQSLASMQRCETWLSGIFLALLVLGIAAGANAGLKMSDILFGRMRT